MVIGHRPTQTDTDISVPRLAGLKESSRFRVRNPLNGVSRRVAPFALPSSAKQKVCVRLESAASGWLIKDLPSLGARQVYALLGVNPKPRPLGPGFYYRLVDEIRVL